MKTCNYCDKQYPDSYEFCPICGHKILDSVIVNKDCDDESSFISFYNFLHLDRNWNEKKDFLLDAYSSLGRTNNPLFLKRNMAILEKVEKYCKQQILGFRWETIVRHLEEDFLASDVGWDLTNQHIAFFLSDIFDKDGSLKTDFDVKNPSFSGHNKMIVVETKLNKVVLITFHKDAAFLHQIIKGLPEEKMFESKYEKNKRYREIRRQKREFKDEILAQFKIVENACLAKYPNKKIILGTFPWEYGFADFLPYEDFTIANADNIFAKQEKCFADPSPLFSVRPLDYWIPYSKNIIKNYCRTVEAIEHIENDCEGYYDRYYYYHLEDLKSEFMDDETMGIIDSIGPENYYGDGYADDDEYY